MQATCKNISLCVKLSEDVLTSYDRKGENYLCVLSPSGENCVCLNDGEDVWSLQKMKNKVFLQNYPNKGNIHVAPLSNDKN